MVKTISMRPSPHGVNIVPVESQGVERSSFRKSCAADTFIHKSIKTVFCLEPTFSWRCGLTWFRIRTTWMFYSFSKSRWPPGGFNRFDKVFSRWSHLPCTSWRSQCAASLNSQILVPLHHFSSHSQEPSAWQAEWPWEFAVKPGRLTWRWLQHLCVICDGGREVGREKQPLHRGPVDRGFRLSCAALEYGCQDSRTPKVSSWCLFNFILASNWSSFFSKHKQVRRIYSPMSFTFAN